MNDSKSGVDAPPLTLEEFFRARLDEAARVREEPVPFRLSQWLQRDVIAKRSILAEHLDSQSQHALGGVIKVLAATYSDHPDYREEWAV